MTKIKTRKNPYPTLSEMGIESPKQIDNYYITSINLVDVLRIVYHRPPGSFLTSSRTYEFPRVQEDIGAGEGSDEKESVVLNTHPVLRAAVKELQMILAAKTSKESIAAEILGEIKLLEEDIAMRTECLKALVRKIPAVE
jgi:hypothetical protein